MEESMKSICNLEDEQKVIVKFLIFNNHKRGYKIQKQLVKIYNENTVALNKIEDWIEEFVGLRSATLKQKDVTDNILHRTENPWRPSFIFKIENDELKTEYILKKVLRILNKITEENYFTLLEQLRSLPIKTEECLRKVVKEILTYVCDEHKYSNLYAKLCFHLSSKYVPYEQQIIGACPMYLTFNELIRSACVDELTMKLKETETLDYNNENKVRYKLKGLNIFISELYKANALMIEVIEEEYLKLLFDDDDKLKKNLFKIECCYVCLNNLGKFLQLQCNETPAKFQKEIFDEYFNKLKNILENDSNSKQLPSYLRFNIMELIELRTRNWIPRANQNEVKNNDDTKRKPRFFKMKKFSYGRRGKFFNNKQRNENKIKNENTVENENEKSPLQIKLESLAEDVKIERKVRSCLNKMTNENSSKLIEQILALPLETISERIVTLIINKAISEPLFNHVYADLCRQLCQKTLPSTNTEHNIEVNNEKNTITFKELIKNECDKIWSTEINTNDNIEDESRFKKKILLKGMPKFIAELFKFEIIPYEIIKTLVEPLFNETNQTIIKIELLCNLLNYCGNLIENYDKECIENYFKNIKIFYENTNKFPKRIRFMLLDLLELRERNWTPRLIPEPVLIPSKNNKRKEQMFKNRLDRRMKNLSISDGPRYRNRSRGYRRNFKFGQKKTGNNSIPLNINDNSNNDISSSNNGTNLELGICSSNQTNNA